MLADGKSYATVSSLALETARRPSGGAPELKRLMWDGK